MAMLLASQLLDSLGYKYSYFVNSDRKHGFNIDYEALRGYFVIAVDFSIPRDIMQQLVDNDIAIVCLDHHAIDDSFIHVYGNSTDAEGIVINNQYDFEPDEDTYLSGAGIVYEAFRELYPDFASRDREAIVGITLLSDARPIENAKARKYLKTTYSTDPQTGYIGYLVSSVIGTDWGFGLPKMDRNFIDFKFSPEVNALLRFGKESEAISFILGGGISCKGLREIQTQLRRDMKQRGSFLELDNLTVVAINSSDFQDYPDIEYIVVDGASSDNSLEIINRYRTQIAKVISETDSGMYEGINKGIKVATGDIVGLLHSDDFLINPHIISDIVARFTETNADIVYGNGLYVDSMRTGKVVRNWVSGNYRRWKVRLGWLPLHPTVYVKRNVIERLGLYNEDYKIAADSDFLVRFECVCCYNF